MTNPLEPVDRRELRISDADRDRTAAVLQEAAGEGRLDLDEVEERLTAIYAAKTYGDLDTLTRDLPQHANAPAVSAWKIGGTPASTSAVAILSGFERKGAWVVPESFTAFTFWGGGELDLREAQFAAREVTINATTVMGGISIIVPEDAEVDVGGIAIMGGFPHDASGQGAPGAPKITVRGVAFWGGVVVERRPPEAELRRRKLQRERERLDSGRHESEDA